MSTDADHELSRSDVQRIQVTISKRWETDPKVKAALLAKVARTGLTTDKARTLLACVRCYMAAEKQNQEDEYRLKAAAAGEKEQVDTKDDDRGQLGRYRVVS